MAKTPGLDHAGARFARLRDSRSETQEQLADRVGLTPETISRFENRGRTSLKTAKKLGDAYGLTVDEVLYGPKPDEPDPLEVYLERDGADLPRQQVRFLRQIPWHVAGVIPTVQAYSVVSAALQVCRGMGGKDS
jgi:transcriptional regulator with XRE-family HTH domain